MNNKVEFTPEQKEVILPILSRMATYQSLMNELSVSLEAVARYLATVHKLDLKEYALAEDGSGFIPRKQE